MNSEELELSLRTEFENYLKGVFAGLRQDVSEFQRKYEAEFEKHKSQLDEAIRDLSARFESDTKFDTAFKESVIEHLRLARDEGALITATAIGEAEKLAEDAAPPVDFKELRDAIKEISSKTSQSAILRSLIENAAQYTPRGAFFIVKNEHFVGWKVFGKEADADDVAVNEIRFPVASETVLARAVESLSTVENQFGENADDKVFLDALDFGQPDRMYAIPLTARGRGVAVLYADYGKEGVSLNAEALETLVRVAGLTVELLANAQAVKPQPQADMTPETEVAEAQPATVEEPSAGGEVAGEAVTETTDQQSAEAEYVEEYAGAVAVQETEDASAFEFVGSEAEVPSREIDVEPAVQEGPVETIEAQPAAEDFAETQIGEPEQPASEAEVSEPVEEQNGNGYGKHVPAVEPVVEVATAQPVRSRFSDRQVDLPIEVTDDERRLHNDARRFARLLVSEIKLYNEQKVNEGREAGDLYDRLREAIDRSREMYEKRVQPPVAAKFDYFHYELVSSLAEGDDQKLGANYPGSSV